MKNNFKMRKNTLDRTIKVNQKNTESRGKQDVHTRCSTFKMIIISEL